MAGHSHSISMAGADLLLRRGAYVYIYIYICYLSLSIYLYIYIYVHMSVCISLSLYIYIYIYTYTYDRTSCSGVGLRTVFPSAASSSSRSSMWVCSRAVSRLRAEAYALDGNMLLYCLFLLKYVLNIYVWYFLMCVIFRWLSLLI